MEENLISNIHDNKSKALFTKSIKNQELSNLGLNTYDKISDKFLIKNDPTEFQIKFKDSARIDLVYKLIPKNINKVPQNLDNSNIFLIVEFEEKRLPANSGKYIIYEGSIIEKFYKNFKKQPKIFFTIIYGPKVIYKPIDFEDFNSIIFKPNFIFLSQTNKSQLYDDLQQKLKSNKKATRLELLRLITLPTIEKNDFETINICASLGSNKKLSNFYVAKDFSYYFSNLYFHALSKNQLDDLKRSTPMYDYIETYAKEKYKVELEKSKVESKNAQDEALVRGKEEGIVIGQEKGINIALAMVAKTMFKQEKSLKEICETLNVSLKWLDEFVFK
jgi:hypothetical protein